MNPGRIVILGAGPCGLGVAHRLAELGHREFRIIERAAVAGGLAGSETDARGFTWDYGGHVLFSRIGYFNQAMDALKLRWNQQRRDARIWIAGRMVPFPLQYNLHHLPEEMARACLRGLRGAGRTPARDFDSWIEAGFGPGLARAFMRPYNEKVWAGPLTRMGVGWVSERVAAPDHDRARANFESQRDDTGWGPNAEFRYPHGGTGAIWRAIAAPLASSIHLDREVIAVDPAGKRIWLADGADERYDHLVSTLPLPELVRLAELATLAPVATDLESTAVHAIGVAIEGETPAALTARRWIYFSEAAYPFYRVSVLSNYAPDMAPPGHWSLLCECAESRHRPFAGGDPTAAVMSGLRHAGLVGAGDRVVGTWSRVIAPGYPVPTLGRDAALAQILPALEKLDIHSRGRFGTWLYEISNQDHAFMQGVELADRLITGGRETLFETRAA